MENDLKSMDDFSVFGLQLLALDKVICLLVLENKLYILNKCVVYGSSFKEREHSVFGIGIGSVIKF